MKNENNFIFLIYILYTTFILCNSLDQTIKEEEEYNITKLEELCNYLFPENEPAGAVLIMKDDKILFEKYYGLTYLPNGTKTDSTTTFNIASVSKQFTAFSILQLISKGNISLEEPLITYFPEYTHPLWKKVKVKHLLSHTSGIPDARGYLNRSQRIYGDENLALEYLQNLTYLHFEPGSNYEYMNPPYVLLGRLIERITNKSFTDYVQENIFTPAEMTQTAYIFQEKNACHAYEYERDSGDSEEADGDRPEGPHDWFEYDYGEETFFATRPDGGIYSNVRDFIKWEKKRPSLLDEKLLNEAYTPHIKVYNSNFSDYQNRPGTYYGFGWFIEPEKKCIYHTGDNGGFKILASRYPEKKAVVLVFAARTDWDRYGIKTEIEEIFNLTQKKEKIFFILQMQKINKKLKIFTIPNFPISENKTFIFSINIYNKNEENEIEFYSKEKCDGNGDKIIELISKEEFDDNEEAVFGGLKNENNIKIKLSENKNNIDTGKVKDEIKKGEVDFNAISSQYKVYRFGIISSNQGCDFNLNTTEKIDINKNKIINLNFTDNINNIEANCTISPDNENKIPCKLSHEVDKNYILEPFIYSDKEETIVLFQNFNESIFSLKCANDDKNSNGLTTGEIIGIIIGVLGIVIIAIIIFVIILKKKGRPNIEENLGKLL